MTEHQLISQYARPLSKTKIVSTKALGVLVAEVRREVPFVNFYIDRIQPVVVLSLLYNIKN